MTPQRWQQVKNLLAEVLDVDPAERAEHLDNACAADPALRVEIETLLAAGERGETASFSVATLEGGAQPNPRIGQRLGPYQLVEEIGAGGMGEVYRAFRADDQYRQQVAIKLVRAGQDSRFIVSRFRNERQVLATLDHPNIARLLDGGTTEDGAPYFVMELIEGKPLHYYCDEHRLSTTARLQLFLQVCSAVQYAHQRLIIHRDLKPGNILVTSEGVPKLLDFGIAKILDPSLAAENTDATLSMFRLLTPAYASPEQIKGEPITTASDVYSLGVVLYELLTGGWPYGATGTAPHEISRAICEFEPERPSAAVLRRESPESARASDVASPPSMSAVRDGSPEKLRKSLRGDLDNIVLMALRKEPQRRYASAEQLAADLRRHLANLPVIATRDTRRYRASKFITRHKAGVAATFALMMVIFAGILTTLYEARRARQNELRAEKRFNDVRALANSLIFEIHDSIQNLPGATPARKVILERALQYLDSLAKESSGDLPLQRELAGAYLRIGVLQGSTSDANLGEEDEALASLKKAIDIRIAVAAADPGNVKDQLNLAVVHHAMARMLRVAGKQGAIEENERALAITAQLLKTDPSNLDVLRERGVEYDVLSDLQPDTASKIDALRDGLRITQDLLKTHPDDDRIRHAFAIGSVKIGNALREAGLLSEALEYNRSGVAVFESLAKTQNDARDRRELAVAVDFQGNILETSGDSSGALNAYRRTLSIVEPMSTADPENAELQLDVAGSLVALARVSSVSGKYAAAEPSLLRSIRLYEENLRRNPSDTDTPQYLGEADVWMGELLARNGEFSLALDSYRKGIAVMEKLPSNSLTDDIRGDIATSQVRMAALLAKIGKTSEAASIYRSALTSARALASANPPNLHGLYAAADASFGIGDLSRLAAQRNGLSPATRQQEWREALEWYGKSAAVWSRVSKPLPISPGFLPCGSPMEVTRAIERCHLALDRNGVAR